jgi:hypothetical protein
VAKIFTTEFSMVPEPAPAAATLVVVTGDAGSAAWKRRPEANKTATMSRVALEPVKNESNPIDETMLDNGRDACKENVVRARGQRETVENVERGPRVQAAGRKDLCLALCTPVLLKIHDLLDRPRKPAIDLCQFENQPDGKTGAPLLGCPCGLRLSQLT